MPSIHPKRHYQLLDTPLIDERPFDMDDLANDIVLYSNKPLRNIRKSLNTYINSEPTPTHKKCLINTLRHIYFALKQDNLSNASKTMIASQLIDYLAKCTAIFQSKTIKLLISPNRPTIIDEFLELMRRNIVDKTARKETFGVLEHHSFFMVAANYYGVRLINPNPGDIIINHELLKRITSSLDYAFKRYYTPLSILIHLPIFIKNELQHYYGYHGHNQSGYDDAICHSIMTCFNALFEAELTHETIFIIEDEKIIDINWHAMQKMIGKHLINEHFFELTDEENLFFNALHHQEIQPLADLLQQNTYSNLLQQLELLAHPKLFHHYSKNRTMLLIDALSKSLTTQSLINHLFGLLKNEINSFQLLLAAIMTNKLLSEQITILSAQHKEVISYNLLMFAIKYQPNASVMLLESIKKLPDNTQKIIFSTKNSYYGNALMIAARCFPALLPALLTSIQKLPEDTQTDIFLTTDQNRCNALLVAAEYQSEALLTLLTATQKLQKSIQVLVLSAKDVDGYNTLMLTTRYHPTILPTLLNVIQQLPKDIQKALLFAKNIYGDNALVIAEHYQPAILPLLNAAIEEITHEDELVCYRF